jgi:hypothetical protein
LVHSFCFRLNRFPPAAQPDTNSQKNPGHTSKRQELRP